MLEVKFYDTAEDSLLKFAVIISRFRAYVPLYTEGIL